MAKAITTTISTVSGNTVNVEKLSERTYRTVREGDYLYASTSVKGQAMYFYGRVESVLGKGGVVLSFGSFGKTIKALVPAKVNVYRPTPA